MGQLRLCWCHRVRRTEQPPSGMLPVTVAQGTESVYWRCHPSLPLPLTLARDSPVANSQKGHRALSHWVRTQGVFAHGAHGRRTPGPLHGLLVSVIVLNVGLRGIEEPTPGHRTVSPRDVGTESRHPLPPASECFSWAHPRTTEPGAPGKSQLLMRARGEITGARGPRRRGAALDTRGAAWDNPAAPNASSVSPSAAGCFPDSSRTWPLDGGGKGGVWTHHLAR